MDGHLMTWWKIAFFLESSIRKRKGKAYIHADVRSIHTSGNDFAIADKDAAYWSFVGLESQFCLTRKRQQHEICIRQIERKMMKIPFNPTPILLQDIFR